MKKTALIAVLFSVNVIVASHDDSMSQRHLKPITNVKIIADLVTTDSQILKFKPGIGQYKETPTPEEVKRINDRLLQAKAVLDMALKDPFLINQGLQDFMEVRQVNLIATGMSQSFDGVIVINPLFKQTNDDLIDTLIHEQLHAIVHN